MAWMLLQASKVRMLRFISPFFTDKETDDQTDKCKQGHLISEPQLSRF